MFKGAINVQNIWKTVRFGGRIMSGDIGLEEPIIFYDEELTETKKVVLEHKGINLAYLEINSQKDGRSKRFSLRR